MAALLIFFYGQPQVTVDNIHNSDERGKSNFDRGKYMNKLERNGLTLSFM